ncbi:MAG: hypothetical protein LBD88_03270 [Candidatus Peribacteria bacterium]|jgi:hypothetical protein|nr:hypothetical protein [Candidatus Peribacteria bacterium]
MVNSSKLNPKLSIPKEIGIGVSRVFLGHWSRLHTSDKVDLIDEFSKKI